MVQILNDFLEARNYEVGDVVYFWFDWDETDRVPTCKAEVLEPDGEQWRFKPLEKQSIYPEKDGIIEFPDKPFVFAKETDERRAEK